MWERKLKFLVGLAFLAASCSNDRDGSSTPGSTQILRDRGIVEDGGQAGGGEVAPTVQVLSPNNQARSLVTDARQAFSGLSGVWKTSCRFDDKSSEMDLIAIDPATNSISMRTYFYTTSDCDWKAVNLERTAREATQFTLDVELGDAEMNACTALDIEDHASSASRRNNVLMKLSLNNRSFKVLAEIETSAPNTPPDSARLRLNIVDWMPLFPARLDAYLPWLERIGLDLDNNETLSEDGHIPYSKAMIIVRANELESQYK